MPRSSDNHTPLQSRSWVPSSWCSPAPCLTTGREGFHPPLASHCSRCLFRPSTEAGASSGMVGCCTWVGKGDVTKERGRAAAPLNDGRFSITSCVGRGPGRAAIVPCRARLAVSASPSRCTRHALRGTSTPGLALHRTPATAADKRHSLCSDSLHDRRCFARAPAPASLSPALPPLQRLQNSGLAYEFRLNRWRQREDKFFFAAVSPAEPNQYWSSTICADDNLSSTKVNLTLWIVCYLGKWHFSPAL